MVRQLAVVAEQGSIRAAAKTLAIAQPAPSRSIRSFEQGVGVVLIERGPRGITITPYAEALLRYAHLIDANPRLAAAELDTVHGLPGSAIRVGMGSFEGYSVGALAIARLNDGFGIGCGPPENP